MEGKTLYEKIIAKHMVKEDRVKVDYHYINEYVSAKVFNDMTDKGKRVRYPEKTIAGIDYNAPTRQDLRMFVKNKVVKEQIDDMYKNCEFLGMRLSDMWSDYHGLINYVGIELGFTKPGDVIVSACEDVEVCGAISALGINAIDVENVLETQEVKKEDKKTIGIKLIGELKEEVSTKDIIISILKKYGEDFGKDYIAEFYGDFVKNLDIGNRMTLCVSAKLLGFYTAIIHFDEEVKKFIEDKIFSLKGEEFEDALVEYKKLYNEEDFYDKILEIDVSEVKREVIEEKEDFLDVDKIFIGSISGAKFVDLKEASIYVRGKKVKKEAYIIPCSKQTKIMAEREGIAKIFIDAGFKWRESGSIHSVVENESILTKGDNILITDINKDILGTGYNIFRASTITACKVALGEY